MIPKYYTCIVVSCVKAPLIKITLLSFVHVVVFDISRVERYPTNVLLACLTKVRR